MAPFFDAHPDAFDQLRASITERDNSVNFDTLTVKSLIQLVLGRRVDELEQTRKSATVGEWVALTNTLAVNLEEFGQFLDDTKPKTTPQAQKLMSGTLPSGIEEAILWTLRESYTLQNLEDAQKLTIYEYKLARKEKYNESVIAYNRYLADMAASPRFGM